jgi:inner membrane transporter RhtA
MRSKTPWLALGSLLLAMTSFQCGAVLAKHLFPAMGAAGTTALRLSLGAGVLWSLRRPWRQWPDKPSRRPLFAYGVSLGLMNLCFYLSLQTIPLGVAIALEFLGPLAIAIWGSRRALDLVWIACALVGLSALLLPQDLGHPLDTRGVVYALLAAIAWGAYIVLGRRAGIQVGANAVALGSALGALVVMPIGIFDAGANLLRWDLWPYALGVAIFSSALPHSLEMTALTRLAPRTVGVLMSVEPALGALFGAWWLAERLVLWQWLGIAAIMVASFGTALETRQAH